jgi:hypothetical protein
VNEPFRAAARVERVPTRFPSWIHGVLLKSNPDHFLAGNPEAGNRSKTVSEVKYVGTPHSTLEVCVWIITDMSSLQSFEESQKLKIDN